jgi:hypothetical protein
MSQVTHASDIGFSTAFAVDKIVGIYTGRYTSGTDTTTLGGFIYRYAIPHSFTRPVFCELLWSTDGVNYLDGGSSSGIATSDLSNIYVLTTQPTGTIYYKIICTWIDNYDNTNPSITPVLNTTNDVYFDSRYNYQKIYVTNVTTVSGGVVDATKNIAHPLGYAPNSKVFIESLPGEVWPAGQYGSSNGFSYAPDYQYEALTLITNSQLQVTYHTGISGAATARIWYKIYLDT